MKAKQRNEGVESKLASIYEHTSKVIEAEWRLSVSELTITGSDNGLVPGRRQTIIETNARMLLIPVVETKLSEIWSEIHFHSRKCIWKYRLRNGGRFVSASVC